MECRPFYIKECAGARCADVFMGGFGEDNELGAWTMDAPCGGGGGFSGGGLPQEYDGSGAKIYYCDTNFAWSDELYGYSLTANCQFRFTVVNPKPNVRYRISVQINYGSASGGCVPYGEAKGPFYHQTGSSLYSFYCTWQESDFENFPCGQYVVHTPYISPGSPGGGGSYLAVQIASATVAEDPV